MVIYHHINSQVSGKIDKEIYFCHFATTEAIMHYQTGSQCKGAILIFLYPFPTLRDIYSPWPDFFHFMFLRHFGHNPMLRFGINVSSNFWFTVNYTSDYLSRSKTQFPPSFLCLSNITPRPLHFFSLQLSKRWFTISVPQIVPELCYSLLPKQDFHLISKLEK